MSDALKLSAEEVRIIMAALYDADELEGATELHDKLAIETGSDRLTTRIGWEIQPSAH